MKNWIRALTLLALPFALSAEEESVQIEKTFTLIKPNAVEHDQIHEILGCFAKEDLRIVQTKRMKLTKEEAELFYSEHKDKPFFDDMISFITSGPVLAVELEGQDAVAKTRRIMGATDPELAAEGTIRKMFGESLTANAVHGSDSYESAARELQLFFGE
jgi:nucleoside-diphosphate kinase